MKKLIVCATVLALTGCGSFGKKSDEQPDDHLQRRQRRPPAAEWRLQQAEPRRRPRFFEPLH